MTKAEENNYWRDFIQGNSLKKYGKIKTIKRWIVDKLIAEFEAYGS
jgi:hypothetical protein